MADKLSIQVPIRDSVLKQLKHRRDLLIRTDETPLYASELMHNNNKGAWIALASSANSNSTNKLARENVLTGGTGFYTIDKDKKYKLNQKEGFLADGNIKSSYNQNSAIGFRPMMGITDLTIASKSTYGVLRQIEIGIKAWSQEQLSILESIYLRPGFTMFVEFGNASYIDADGELTSKTEALHLEFLKGTDLDKLQGLIKLKREQSGYNYDAMIGKVQNFSWSFAKDGSYDCSLKLISKGELAESLSILQYDKKQEIPETIKESGKDTPNDLLLGMLIALNNVKGPIGLSNFQQKFELNKDDGKAYYSYTPNIKDNSDEQDTEEGEVQTAASNFIPIYSFLRLLNTKFIEPTLKDKNNKPQLRFNEDPTVSKYNYFISNISNDPFVCSVLYNDGDKGKCLYSQKELYGGQPPREALIGAKFEKAGWGEKFRYDSPYFILINVQCLIDIQKSFIAQKKQNADLIVSAFSFVKKVLELVNSALGGICHLDLTKDDDTDTWIIIDRNCNESIPTKKAIPALDLVGLGSLVQDIKLESKISNSLASALAIAARSTSVSEASESFLKLNSGVTDRYTEVSQDSATKKLYKIEKLAEDKKAIEENQKVISTAYKKYIVDRNFTQSNFDGITSDHRNYMSFERTNEKVRKSAGGKTRTFDGLIPFDLSLTLDGITGLRPTDCFTVGKNVLPDRYIGKVGFIITNINHSIGNDNRWITELSSKMFMLPDNQPVDTELLLEEVETFIPPATDSSKMQLNVKAVYGEPGVWGNLEKLDVPEGFNLTYGGKKQDSIMIHRDVKDNLNNAMIETLNHYGKDKLKDLRINIYNGAYNNRNKRGGVTKSMHAWGIALDFDASNNKLRWKRDKASFAKPEYIKFLEIFKKYGFYNLGTEKNYDYMHFQAWDPNQKE